MSRQVPVGSGENGQTRASRHLGFTLLELLVVLCIIGILSSMLLAAVQKARIKAQETVCRNNLKQLGYAFQSYLTDWQGKTFAVQFAPDKFWMAKVHEYAPSKTLLVCPAAPVPTDRLPDAESFGSAVSAWYGPRSRSTEMHTGFEGSYGMNGWTYSEEGAIGIGTRKMHFNREWDFRNPDKNPVFADSVFCDGWPGAMDNRPANLLYDESCYLKPFMARFCISRHGKARRPTPAMLAPGAPMPGSIQVVFADNTVRPVELEDLWPLYWHVDYQPPTR